MKHQYAFVWNEVFLSPNVPKSRRNYEENQTDKIVSNTNNNNNNNTNKACFDWISLTYILI
jgi:hypothetical protein